MLDKPVTIVIEPRGDGGIRVHSPDEPGLILSGPNPALVMGDVLTAVRMLREHRAEEAAKAETEARIEADLRAAGWIEWTGGKCPVPPDTMVHFRVESEIKTMRDGCEPSLSEDAEGRAASSLRWTWKDGSMDNIAAYRIVPTA